MTDRKKISFRLEVEMSKRRIKYRIEPTPWPPPPLNPPDWFRPVPIVDAARAVGLTKQVAEGIVRSYRQQRDARPEECISREMGIPASTILTEENLGKEIMQAYRTAAQRAQRDTGLVLSYYEFHHLFYEAGLRRLLGRMADLVARDIMPGCRL